MSWAKLQDVDYHYLGNFKGVMNIPNIPGKLTVILFSYDEFYDWAGKTLAYNAGYRFEDYAEVFEKWMTIDPNDPVEMNKRKIRSIKHSRFSGPYLKIYDEIFELPPRKK